MRTILPVVIFAFLKSVPAVSGDINVIVPAGSEVYIDNAGSLIKFGGTGTNRTFSYPDYKMEPGLRYSYTVRVIWNGKETVREFLVYRNNPPVTFDFTEFVERVDAKKLFPVATETTDTGLPHLISKNEVLTKVFKDYLQGAGVPDPSDFSSNDVSTLKCRGWNILDATASSFEVGISEKEIPGLLTFTTSFLSEKVAKDYLLAESENGFRTTLDATAGYQWISPLDLANLMGSGPAARSLINRSLLYESTLDEAKLLAAIAYQSRRTFCLTSNKFKPNQYFFEVGTRSSLSFHDRDKKEIDPKKVPSVTLAISPHSAPFTFTRGDVLKKVLEAKDGNHSLPPSHCFRDFVADVTSTFRMTSLGVCAFRK